MLNMAMMTFGVFGSFQPILTAILLSWGLFALFSLLLISRCLILLVGLFARRKTSPGDRTLAPDAHLPVFTILIAAYREATMMDQLAEAMRGLDWPASRLEVLLLLEADDAETIAAARAAALPDFMRIIQVPAGGPRTKPNALNYGLTLARGDIITVYDVEDIPAPDQLRHVLNAFQRASHRTVCVQAPLIADNAQANWLAAQWALEYDVQFGLLLPGLAAYRLPILLGGTSNHFRRGALLALGGWDAWNVTEDADLGMRMARARLQARVIRAPTHETAPMAFRVWSAQRSRWLKGFMQTWLVLMRNPRKTLRQMGLAEFVIMQLSLGGAILSPLAYAPSVFLVSMALSSGQMSIGAYGIGLLCGGLLVGLIGDLAAPGKWTWMRVAAILTRPLYWPLHTLAAYRALWELAERPFFWAKTPHHPREPEPDPLSYSTGSSA